MKDWRKPFFTIWSGQAFSLLGSNLVQFALVWWLTTTTDSAGVLAAASLISLLPGIALGPVIGALVDRWNRRWVMVVADTSVALATLLLILLFWLNWVQTWHIFVILLLRAVGGAFHLPAMQASTSLMVPEQHLARVAGLNQTLAGIINIAGPAMGAFLIAALPLYGVLSIDLITAALAVFPLLFIPVPQPPNAAPASGSPSPRVVWADMRAGFRYLLAWPGMVAVMGLAALINFWINPAFTLLPLLITRWFQGGVAEIGATDSAWGIGVVAGGALLGAWGGFKRKVDTALAGMCLLGLGILCIGLAPADAVYWAVAGMALAGFAQPVYQGPMFAVLQARVAPEMQGRVFTLVYSFAGAMTLLGMLLSAPLTDWLGLRAWYWVAGGLILLAGAFLRPVVRGLEA